MASSKGSPGPHDRQPTRSRVKCMARTRTGRQCKRYASTGSARGNRLCRFHLLKAQGEVMARNPNSPNPNELEGPAPSTLVKAGISTDLGKKFKLANEFVLNEQSKVALKKLGLEPTEGFDPKTALLATVESAFRQARVWEAMLASVPEEDWKQVGNVPIPGLPETARGARIEAMQRFLGEATKNAARVSKLAIDAGIEERIVRLAEEQSALIADTVRAGIVAAIGTLRLSPQAEAKAIEAAMASAAHKLRMLAAGGEEVVEGIAREVGPRNVTPQPVA
jgi:hypothetical protein